MRCENGLNGVRTRLYYVHPALGPSCLMGRALQVLRTKEIRGRLSIKYVRKFTQILSDVDKGWLYNWICCNKILVSLFRIQVISIVLYS